MIQVPLLDLHEQTTSLRAEIDQAIQGVLDRGDFILGSEVDDLEREVADYSQCRFAVGVASGTDALLLALKGCEIGTGDEVVTSPYTFFATAGAVHNLGARPIFADVDPVTFNIRPEEVERRITRRTRAIIPVHLFGQCAPMKPLQALCRERGLRLIEDAAQAIGARQQVDGMWLRAGSFGDCAGLSFFPSKNLGGIGDGGMVITNSDDLARRIRVLRVHGSSPKYYHHVVGYNSRLDTINAAVLRVKLRHLENWTQKRRINARRYCQLFTQAGLEEVLTLPTETEGNYHIYNQYVIRCETRDQLQNFLHENGISAAIYYPVPLHLQKCFDYLGYREGDFPISEKLAKSTLALPIYPELTAEKQEYVVEAIGRFYGRR